MILELRDLEPFMDTSNERRIQEMIDDVEARALHIAPCLNDPEFQDHAVAKAILRQIVIRWSETGSGALTQRQQTAGPFSLGESFDTRQERRTLFWPSEIADLSALCRDRTADRRVHVGWLA